MSPYTPTPTEMRILAAAEEIFLQKGFRAATTQDIADYAGCNQALVHYYYRTKENLFLKVFAEKTELVFNSFAEPLRLQQDILQTVRTMVDAYFDFLSANERLPYFIVTELVQNNDLMQLVIDNFEKDPVRRMVFLQFDERVQAGIRDGLIRSINAADLMLHIISLCVCTFMSKPLLSRVLTDTDALARDYLTHRKEEIIQVIIRGIQP